MKEVNVLGRGIRNRGKGNQDDLELMVLAAFADRYGEESWARLAEIVEETGLNKYVVQGLIYRLESIDQLRNRMDESPLWQATADGRKRVKDESDDLVKRVQLSIP